MKTILTMLFLLVPFAALAQKPTITYFDFTGTAFTLPASAGFCPFDIYEQPVGNKEKIATFYDKAGQVKFQIITGVNKWMFTNLSTGKAVQLNASGPGRLTFENNTVILSGSGESFFYISNPPAGFPKLSLTRGRIVAEVDPTTFTVTNLITQHGTVQDICTLLE